MSVTDEVLKILDTPESEGGLSDSEKILAASNVLRAFLEEPVPVAPVPAVTVEPVVTPAPVVDPAAPTV